MTTVLEKFGKLIRFHRNQFGWTQEQLVMNIREQPGYSEHYGKSAVSKWENGKGRPRIEVIEILADIFSIPRRQLLEAADFPYPEYPETKLETAVQLFADIQKLAAVLKSLIYVPVIITVSESLKNKIVPNEEQLKPIQTVVEYFEEYFRLNPEKRALFNHFISLPTSNPFKTTLEQWKQTANYYYNLVGSMTDSAQINRAYEKAKEAAEQAVSDLFKAVEAFRWDF